MKLLYLALIWSLWCALHSFMISGGVMSYLKERFGEGYRYYRMFFNFVSVVTLVPVLIYSGSLQGVPFFTWAGAWRPVQIILAAGAIALFYAGARDYDLKQFLGIRQVVERNSGMGLTESGGLDTSGILGVIRHPWYSAAILIIWARPLDTAVLVTNAVLTAYLFIGAVLEERKLVAVFGDEYREYQKRVPMFFPRGKKSVIRDA